MGFVVGAAQMAPVWMDRERTLDKVVHYVQEAADSGCDLVVFPETVVPGYPFWHEQVDPAKFDLQSEIHALYLEQAVQIEAGHLDEVLRVARDRRISVVLGIAERPSDRGGHSIYCSAVTIDSSGAVASVHRKLVPTYWERMSWANGDGHGLVTHRMGDFTVGTLNCFENWMPLSRTALYAQGEDLHVALWPAYPTNTLDVSRFIATEGKSYVVSVAGVLRHDDIPDTLPGADVVRAEGSEFLAVGGTCIVAPDGSWVVEPVMHEERLVVAELDHARVRAQRQGFDLAGHYSRPDVTHLSVDRRRQAIATFTD
jgi:nitrilase